MPRLARIAGPAVLLLSAVAALLVALAYGSVDAPSYGLAVSTLLVNLGGAGTLGALVLALVAFDSEKPEFARALDVAAGSAALWTVAAGVTSFLTFVTVLEQPIRFDDAFGDMLLGFVTGTELGQAWLATTLVAAVVTALCFAVRQQTALVFVALAAVIGLIPIAVQSYRGGPAQNASATTALVLHVLFAAVWLGGLVTLILCRSLLDTGRLVVVLARYSTIALLCFVVVAASGYLSAELRVASLENLLTPYGVLVLVKVAALVVLGLLAAGQRRLLLLRLPASSSGGRGIFWWIAASELAFMGIASGVAAALARTAAPVPETVAADPTPAEVLTGSPLPPPVSIENLLRLGNIDLVWILVCAFGIVLYLLGVRRLRRRGDRWPIHRTVFWIVGMLLLFFATNGGVSVYERYLFSQQLLALLLIGLAVPVLLVPGAPLTLALRAIRPRGDGSLGGREWLVIAVRSRPFAVLANPVVAAILFVASTWVFYYTPLFSWATTSQLGHQWMIVHFLVTGYLFAQSLVGIDPSPARLPYPVRLPVVLVAMASLGLFGLVIGSSTGLLLADWYGAMGWETGVTAIVDQQSGGVIVGAMTALVAVVLTIAVATLWARSRRDRARGL